MSWNLDRVASQALLRQSTDEILRCNEISVRYGLALTQEQALELLESRDTSLRRTGRVEFGAGVVDQLIVEFCDSPYLIQEEYADTLQQLLECFYYLKGESMEAACDEELLHLMRVVYDVEGGALDALHTCDWDTLRRMEKEQESIWPEQEGDYD